MPSSPLLAMLVTPQNVNELLDICEWLLQLSLPLICHAWLNTSLPFNSHEYCQYFFEWDKVNCYRTEWDVYPISHCPMEVPHLPDMLVHTISIYEATFFWKRFRFSLLSSVPSYNEKLCCVLSVKTIQIIIKPFACIDTYLMNFLSFIFLCFSFNFQLSFRGNVYESRVVIEGTKSNPCWATVWVPHADLIITIQERPGVLTAPGQIQSTVVLMASNYNYQ